MLTNPSLSSAFTLAFALISERAIRPWPWYAVLHNGVWLLFSYQPNRSVANYESAQHGRFYWPILIGQVNVSFQGQQTRHFGVVASVGGDFELRLPAIIARVDICRHGRNLFSELKGKEGKEWGKRPNGRNGAENRGRKTKKQNRNTNKHNCKSEKSII